MKIYGKRLRLTPQEEDIIRQFRGKTLDNINDNTALDLHLYIEGCAAAIKGGIIPDVGHLMPSGHAVLSSPPT